MKGRPDFPSHAGFESERENNRIVRDEQSLERLSNEVTESMVALLRANH